MYFRSFSIQIQHVSYFDLETNFFPLLELAGTFSQEYKFALQLQTSLVSSTTYEQFSFAMFAPNHTRGHTLSTHAGLGGGGVTKMRAD